LISLSIYILGEDGNFGQLIQKKVFSVELSEIGGLAGYIHERVLVKLSRARGNSMNQEKIQITSFFRCPSEVAHQIRINALKKLRSALSSKATRIGLGGSGFENCLEDWINEGYLAAEEQYERWDPARCGPDHWVFLKAQDIALRWIERLVVEYKKLQELVLNGSSLVQDGRRRAGDHQGIFHQSEFILSILKEDLSASDSRILKLYLKGCSISEIAELEGLSVQTAQRRLNRAQVRARSARKKRIATTSRLGPNVVKTQRRSLS